MYSVIDIGSNTIRLVIFRLEAGTLIPSLSSKSTAGLAGYIDKKNCLSRQGIQRLVLVLQQFKAMAELLPDCPLYPFATASLRNIVNTDQVLETVRRKTGLDIQVLSGHEEAMLDYRGAMRNAGMDEGLLLDVGGGSTELVFFKDRTVLAARSLPLGSLNLYGKYVGELIPKEKELRAMREAVRDALKEYLPLRPEYVSQPICGVGGTVRGALALCQSMNKTSRRSREFSVEFLNEVLHLAREEPHKLMRRILKVAPERVHTLTPGILILSAAADYYGSRTVFTSPYGVREGYLSHILEKEGILCE